MHAHGRILRVAMVTLLWMSGPATALASAHRSLTVTVPSGPMPLRDLVRLLASQHRVALQVPVELQAATVRFTERRLTLVQLLNRISDQLGTAYILVGSAATGRYRILLTVPRAPQQGPASRVPAPPPRAPRLVRPATRSGSPPRSPRPARPARLRPAVPTAGSVQTVPAPARKPGKREPDRRD